MNATKFSPICHQIEKLFNYTESEDCLALNVFTPNPTKCGRKRLPVVASIYGGGFISGLSDDLWFGADFLMEQCVVLVTMNYRLGPFGFLSLAQSEYSGNMGLKDQQLALKWIHDNIYAFGGDKRNVTLIGTSAGSYTILKSFFLKDFQSNISAFFFYVNDFLCVFIATLKVVHRLAITR